jgi:NADPH-dependent curcumin reductase CurA
LKLQGAHGSWQGNSSQERPSGFVAVDDFELVEVEVPKVSKEGEFLVRNIWMSIDPFL